jgi:hypothetical protein
MDVVAMEVMYVKYEEEMCLNFKDSNSCKNDDN